MNGLSYRHQKYLVVTLLLLFFAISIFIEATRRADTYPFFSWRLFAYVPNTVHTYVIEVDEMGGKVYTPPLHFTELRFLFDSIAQSPTDYEQTLRNLGNALQYKDETLIELYRAEAESIFPNGAYEYSVLHVKYDSMLFWKTKEFEKRQTVGHFSGYRSVQ